MNDMSDCYQIKNCRMGGTEGGGSNWNRFALNIRTTSGYTRGVTALGTALMNSIISVSAARLISFD